MTTFYKKVPLIILLFQVFALAPFSSAHKNSLFMRMISLCSLLISLTLFAFPIFISDFFIYLTQNSVEIIVSVIIFSCTLLTHLIVIAQSYVTRNKQFQIIENICTIDDLLRQKFGKYQINHNYNRYIFGIFSFMVCTLIMSTILLVWRTRDLLFTLYYVYPLMLTRVRCIQVIFYVAVLRERLKTVTDIFVHVINCEEEVNKSPRTIIILSGDIIKRSDRIAYIELVALKKIYSYIWDTNYLMNDCFGWSLLFIFTLFFALLTTDCYWLYLTYELTDYELYEVLCEAIGILNILWLICNGCRKCSQSVCLYNYKI